MWLHKAQKILQKKYTGMHCSVKVECSPTVDENIAIVWALYVGNATTGHIVEAYTFKKALEKMWLKFHPKKVKSQDVEIRKEK